METREFKSCCINLSNTGFTTASPLPKFPNQKCLLSTCRCTVRLGLKFRIVLGWRMIYYFTFQWNIIFICIPKSTPAIKKKHRFNLEATKYLSKWSLNAYKATILKLTFIIILYPLIIKKLVLRFCTQIALCKIYKHLFKLIHRLHKYGS